MSRVVFINRYFYPDESATAQLLSDVAFGLGRSGLDVHIVCSRQLYGDPDADLTPREDNRGVVIHRIWTTRFGRTRLWGRALDYGSFYVVSCLTLAALLRAGDVVVAKTDPPLISIVAAAIARFKGALLVNWLQDIFPEVASRLGTSPLPPVLDRAVRWIRDESLRSAAMNVVLGTRMYDYVRARRVPAAKCRVVENWADAETVHPKSGDASELRGRLGLSDKFVIGYSGNLGRAHEFATVLGAAEELSGDEQIVFLFIGGGVKMDELKSLVGRKCLPNFRFLPHQPRHHLEDSLAAADVHMISLIPALEGMIVPSKFYGVLAAGRPVLFVGDPDGELARIISQYHCGYAVAEGDIGSLVGAINAIRSDPAARKTMGSAARELLCAQFSARRGLRAWSDIFEELGVVQPTRR